MAPAIGATQKSQSCESAHPPATMAGPVERAGLTEVFVTGIETRWMSVRQRRRRLPRSRRAWHSLRADCCGLRWCRDLGFRR
jgi:hypothetical protein